MAQGIDKIMNNNDMKSVLMGNKEIVVYGAGNMGRAVIRLIMEMDGMKILSVVQ